MPRLHSQLARNFDDCFYLQLKLLISILSFSLGLDDGVLMAALDAFPRLPRSKSKTVENKGSRHKKEQKEIFIKCD